MTNIATPIDWDALLHVTQNKKSLANEILNMFKNELPTMKADIQSAYHAKNYENLADLIHKLHGSCCYCGAVDLKSLTARIESDLNENNLDTIDQDLINLNAQMDGIIHYLNHYNDT